MINIASKIHFMNLISKLFTSFFLFFYMTSVSQEIYQNDYIGNLTIYDTIQLSYRIEFNIDKQKIIGFSYTDIGGADETKSKIIGTYDKVTKIVTFKEKEITYTKSIFNENDFCFVNAKAKLKIKKNKSLLTGDFTGTLSDGSKCIDGKFTLINIKTAKKKLNQLTKKVNKSKFISKKDKEKFNNTNLLEQLKPSILNENENLTLFWKTNYVKLEIWDNKKEDNDRISVNINGKDILVNYILKNKKKYLKVALNKDKNIIKIYANNEGYAPPNTATINLVNEYKIVNLTTSLKAFKTTTITLIKR